MKKMDLHIHTFKTTKDSDFIFSIDSLKRYVKEAKIDILAITNHNYFDSSQFRQIQQEIQASVFPGIEIDLQGGHILLIADGGDVASFDSKCALVSTSITDTSPSLSVTQLQDIFGDLSSYLIIPHYFKCPEIKKEAFNALIKYFAAGEVDSAKKFIRLIRDKKLLCPVLFSDIRISDKLSELPTRQTYINCGEVSLPSIKSCLSDKNKVFLSENDGNQLFKVFDNGQHISTGLNVILGGRSSGKTFTLDRLSNIAPKIKYIKQFDLVQHSQEDEKRFNNSVQQKRGLFVDDYLSGLRSIIKEISSIDLDKDDRSIVDFINTLKQSAEESDRQDAFSKVKLYNEMEFSVSDAESLKKLIASVIHLIENKEYRSVIDAYIKTESLKSLAIDLMQKLWENIKQNKKRNHVNSIIKDVKDRLRMRTSATHVTNIDLFNITLNKRKVIRFTEIAKALQTPRKIYDESIQGFRITVSKGPFKHASEMQDAIKRQAAYKEALEAYNNPFGFLQILKGNDKIQETDIPRLFVNFTYQILNKDGNEVSGGERSEFRLLQEIKDAQSHDLLLLDEPESSFDNKFLNTDVNDIIKTISKEMPVVVVTHNNNIGASIRPDYVLFTQKIVVDGVNMYKLYSGYPTDKLLKCTDGTSIKTHSVLLNSLEAGIEPYDDRRSIYEAIKD